MIAEIAGGVALAGLATWAGFESMWPTMHAYGRSFVGLPPGTRKLALTYDDGPNDPYTLQLMDVLARHDVKATFFVLGKFVQDRPEIVRALAAAGHDIGNHSWDHPRLIFASDAELRSQIERTQTAVLDACGATPTLFRPPYGGRRPGTLQAVRALGLEPVMWNVTCYDWKATSADRVFAHAQRQIRGGDVILMHDGDQRAMGADRRHTVEATDRLIAKYKADGYEFLTIPLMMAGGSRTHSKRPFNAIYPRPLTKREADWVIDIMRVNPLWQHLDPSSLQINAEGTVDQGMAFRFLAEQIANVRAFGSGEVVGNLWIQTAGGSTINVQLTQIEGRLGQIYVLYVDPKDPRATLPDDWVEVSREAVNH